MALSHLEFSTVPLIQRCLTRNFLVASQPSEVSTVNFSNMSRLHPALCTPEETKACAAPMNTPVFCAFEEVELLGSLQRQNC